MSILDIASWRLLLSLFAGGILAFGLLYFEITKIAKPEHGLVKSSNAESVTYLESLYFSLLTQATVSYGDIQPRGVTRLVASIQIVWGLLIGGLVVAKITSLPIASVHHIEKAVAGYWWDYVTSEGGHELVGVLTITRRGLEITYSGDDYASNDTRSAFFSATLVQDKWPTLIFLGSTRDSTAEFFGDSVVALKFTEKAGSATCDHFVGQLNDYRSGVASRLVGYRLTQEEKNRYDTPDEKPGLIAELIAIGRQRTLQTGTATRTPI